jgi:hypothetical protein
MPGMTVKVRVTSDRTRLVVRRLRTMEDTTAREIATRFRRNVRGRTPVGKQVYTDRDGTHPGVLKKGTQVDRITSGHYLIANPVSYGPYVNDGTHRMAPRPFWTQSVAEAEHDAPAALFFRLWTVDR